MRPFHSTASHLDTLDVAILQQLQQDGRISNKAISLLVGASAPNTLRRRRRLERLGYIAGYAVQLSDRCVAEMADPIPACRDREARRLGIPMAEATP
jgi:DNA-binding Lrp family transcriptional regulator